MTNLLRFVIYSDKRTNLPRLVIHIDKPAKILINYNAPARMKSLLNFALLSLGEAGISSAYTISNLYLTPPQLVSRKRAVERMVSMAGGMLV